MLPSKSTRSRTKARTRARAVAFVPPSPPPFPWHRLPLELQQRIFYFAASRYEDNTAHAKSPLSLVSKAWRELCVRTPQLWTHYDIWLNDPLQTLCHFKDPLQKTPVDELYAFFESRVQNARCWLSRAKALRTHITLELHHPCGDFVVGGQYRQLFKSLLNISPNLGTLTCVVDANWLKSILPIVAATEGDFSALDRLVIATISPSDMGNISPELLGEHVSNLSSLTALELNLTTNSAGIRNTFHDVSTNFPVHQLRTLTLVTRYVNEPSLYWDTFLPFLVQCKNLEALALLIPGWDNDLTNSSSIPAPVILPRLKCLQIQLESFNKAGEKWNLNPILQSLTLPLLTGLYINNYMLGSSVPCVAQSLIDCHKRSGFTLDRFGSAGIRWDISLLISLLKVEGFNELTFLYLANCDTDFSTLLRRLMVKPVATSEDTSDCDLDHEPFLPRLEEFHFVQVSDRHINLQPPNPRPFTTADLIELFKSRWNTGDSAIRRCRGIRVVLRPALEFDERSSDEIRKLKRRGMSIGVTKEEYLAQHPWLA